MAHAYFEVGEEIILAAAENTAYNGERTVSKVLPHGSHTIYRDNKELILNVKSKFAYKMVGVESPWFGEPALRKKYKRPDESFLDMLYKITDKANAL